MHEKSRAKKFNYDMYLTIVCKAWNFPNRQINQIIFLYDAFFMHLKRLSHISNGERIRFMRISVRAHITPIHIIIH